MEQKIKIIYEDADVVVLDKPAGLKVHAVNAKDVSETLADWVREHIPEAKLVGDDPALRPGIVHRLDKEASGVLIVAKNQTAYLWLKKQFQERTVEKYYDVLVYGRVSKDEGEIKFRISRGAEGRMAAHPVERDIGREAWSSYEVVRRLPTTTLLRVRIHTGRTHQIRVHFFALGHPVVGDTLYERKHMRHVRPIILPRLFLHAAEMHLTLPDGSQKIFHAPLPPELMAIIS